MLVGMIVVVVVVSLAVVLAGIVAVALSARRAFDRAVGDLARRQATETDAAVAAALDHVDRLNRSHLDGKSELIGAGLDSVRDEMRHELERLGQLVAQVGASSAQQFGQVDQALRMHAEVTGSLAASTTTLREALASPQARGRWGSGWPRTCCGWPASSRTSTTASRSRSRGRRRQWAAGLHVRPPQGPRPPHGRQVPAGVVPALPRRHHRPRPGRVPQGVPARRPEPGEGAGRSGLLRRRKPSVDYVLLFLPNEQLSGFIHEHDPGLLDDALRQRVVMCSPLTLFAFLGVIRQAFDNFMIEQTSDEILALVGTFNQQWKRYVDSADKVKRHFAQVHAEFDHLTTTRERAVERPLRQLEALREQRAIPIAADESDGGLEDPAEGAGPALRVVDRGR